MKRQTLGVSMVMTILMLAGCMPDPKSGAGFTLPEGDADAGRDTFVQLQCNACHTIKGTDLEQPETTAEVMIVLGGETAVVRTYGQLVTSIINPSHRFVYGYDEDAIKTDGKSKMRLYNDEMTVNQLSDLVAFLQSSYRIKPYQPTPYLPYY